MAAIAVCVWAAFQSAWPSWRMLLILMATGSLLYLFARPRRLAGGDTEPDQV
jgi:hypothetical protein